MFEAFKDAHVTASLCQCSFLWVFRATTSYTEQKEAEARNVKSPEIKSQPLTLKVAHKLNNSADLTCYK